MALKVKFRTQFPAVVTASSPIIVTKSGVTYSFTFDESGFQALLNPLYAQLTNNLSDLAFPYIAKDNISLHGANIASAATVNLETATGDLVDVTGTVTITAITLNEGHQRTVRFTGALTLTNGASLVLPGSANITTAAGDFAVFRGYAAGVVRCVQYNPLTGKALIPPAVSEVTGYAAGVATFLATPTSANLLAAITDETGTGAAVFANTPTLVTPVLGVATATSLNKVTVTAPATSATLTLIDGTILTGPAATGTLVSKTSTDVFTNKTFDSAGSGNVLQVGSVTLSKGQYPGETTTGNATAGNVGEYIESVIVSGSAVSLVTATAKTVTSISLTAGDWDVDCVTNFLSGGSTAITFVQGGISLSTNTQDLTAGRAVGMLMASTVTGASTNYMLGLPPYRISISGTTAIFQVALASFATAGLSAWGLLRARRVR